MDALQQTPVRMSTMGRTIAEDAAYFLASAAAGRHAAQLLAPQRKKGGRTDQQH
jgi:hypothetical protein